MERKTSRKRPTPPSSARLLLFVLEWVCLFGLWLLFVAKWSHSEVYLGLGASLAATLGSALVEQQRLASFSPHLRWLQQGWRIPGYVVSGSIELLRALARQLFTRHCADSLVRAVHFDAGGNDAHSQARRALAVAYTTSTPNFIVIDIVPDQELLLFHQVLRGEIRAMTRNLGARG